ncbi:hypothetical protein [Clostridium saccharoperbutylacetonicum]|uniref:hypothetical protein n=1 Tax=Clostridium saccharoperbutylacetonicum TaxID=36745 RepID=UPI000983FBBC|nr:hypothetical protein [Clostridium saccharoperbutylacetonicum]AQR95558.1 hypothetical protein CLSAP_28740 [Clostridium saccharoperbutylacetonicum]NSB31418.1 hypothetical protein [Clostridium saccharoperbutylacetonicum]
MHQSSFEVIGGQKKLRLISGDHFISLPINVKKSDVASLLNSDEVLEAGNLLTITGKPVTTTSTSSDAYGVVYQDISFKNSMSADSVPGNATEIVPTIVHGVLYESQVKFSSTNAAIEKAALKQIIFGA